MPNVAGWQRKLVTVAVALCVVSGLSACGPAVRTANSQTTTARSLGTPVAVSAWADIVSGAEAGTQISRYKQQVTSSLVQGSLRSTYSVYGAVNTPNRISLTITEGNTQTEFYQQGSDAYSYDNGKWSSSTPIVNVDVYPTYQSIAIQARKTNISLYQLPREYVQDEYCSVYQSILPASILTPLKDWPNITDGDVGQILVTWYIGQTDGVLRQVDTQSVGGVPDVGSMQIDTSTLMFDLNNKIAQIQIPKTLVLQLENVSK